MSMLTAFPRLSMMLLALGKILYFLETAQKIANSFAARFVLAIWEERAARTSSQEQSWIRWRLLLRKGSQIV
jgi:hypothetical protein